MSNTQAFSHGIHVQSVPSLSAIVPRMDPLTPRAILANNVLKLIGTDSVRNWAISRGLDVRLIDRITKGGNATLETVDLIASACGVPAWHLLLPEFEPGTRIDKPVTEAERQLLERLKRLIG